MEWDQTSLCRHTALSVLRDCGEGQAQRHEPSSSSTQAPTENFDFFDASFLQMGGTRPTNTPRTDHHQSKSTKDGKDSDAVKDVGTDMDWLPKFADLFEESDGEDGLSDGLELADDFGERAVDSPEMPSTSRPSAALKTEANDGDADAKARAARTKATDQELIQRALGDRLLV